MKRILLIEDDPQVREQAERTLTKLGHRVEALPAAAAVHLLGSGRYDAVIASMLPLRGPAGARIPDVIQLPAPLASADLRAAVDDAAAAPSLVEVPRIVGGSPAMLRLRAQLEAIADADAPVVLSGETGTGKELLARAIHAMSARRGGAFVAINGAAIPDALFESELFGHERGAFTGAISRRDGRLRTAHGGTLLLDEVDALSLTAQAKLLRVLQDGVVQPVGSDVEHAVDVRVICATNRRLREVVASGQFREDLYYRIQVLDLDIPPLRERRGDLRPLVEHFLAAYARAGASRELAPAAWAALAHHRFPGNVRELEHVCQRALVMARGQRIEAAHLPPELRLMSTPSPPREVRPLAHALRTFERGYLERVLQQAGGNKTLAAKLLGISRKNLWERLGRTAPTAEEVSDAEDQPYDQ